MKNRKAWAGMILMLLCMMIFGTTIFAADIAMKNKKWLSGQGGIYIDTDNDGIVDDYKNNGTVYYKITIPKQGYIMVDVQVSKLPKEDEYFNNMGYDEEYDESYTDVTFMNASKKNILQCDNFVDDGKKNIRFSAAVKKGTYYLAVQSEQAYKLRYSFTAVEKLSKAGKVKEGKKGNTVKGAPTLKKGVTAKNLILSSSQEDGYLIKLSKQTKVRIKIQSKITGGLFENLNCRILVKKGKVYKTVNEKGKELKKGENYSWKFEEETDTIVATLPKGTYCIGIYSFGSTGYYTVKWK